MRRIGYIRTSRDGQLTDRQIRGLRPHCDELRIEEGVSARRKHRPVYQAMTEALQRGDMLVVWSLDRAFRSTIDALLELKKLDERGIEFHSVTQNFDTSTPEGRLQFTLIAAIAEWERAIISQRTKEGLKAAKARGVRLGRPPKRKPDGLAAENVVSLAGSQLDKRAQEVGASTKNPG